MSFEGKVVIVTGASSGIGAETAREFSKLGASLVLVGRNLENLQKVAKECSSPEKVLTIQADVTIPDDGKRIINKSIEKFARLDLLINNAGIIETGSIENTSIEQFDRVMNTNVRSIYNLTMLAVPHLIKTEGSIVNVSSVCGLRAFPNVLAYNISKSAVDQFTRCVALELAPKKVRVNSVNPGEKRFSLFHVIDESPLSIISGVTVTDLHKRGGMDEETYAKFLEHCKATHALGRPGTVQEIAGVITFLASSSASFITGATLPVDGGRHAMCPR